MTSEKSITSEQIILAKDKENKIMPPNTIFIDSNEYTNHRGKKLETYFKNNTNAYVFRKKLPAGDIIYLNNKFQWVCIEYKEGIDLTISQDNKHLHKQIDNMQIYDKICVIATDGYIKNLPHNNYWSKWMFKNVHFIPCTCFDDAKLQMRNIFNYSNRESWLPEAQVDYSCKMGAIKSIKGVGESTYDKLYRDVPNGLDGLMSMEVEDFKNMGIRKDFCNHIYNSLHNT